MAILALCSLCLCFQPCATICWCVTELVMKSKNTLESYMFYGKVLINKFLAWYLFYIGFVGDFILQVERVLGLLDCFKFSQFSSLNLFMILLNLRKLWIFHFTQRRTIYNISIIEIWNSQTLITNISSV